MINSLLFEFGNNPEQYPINGIVTDTSLRVCEVAGLSFGTQYYTSGFTQGNGYVDYSNLFTPTAGEQMRIHFVYPLIFENA